MYLVNLKTLLVRAMKSTLDADYVEPDMRGLLVSMEMPVREQDYPSVWVDFEPVGDLKVVGINHHEIGDPSGDGNTRRYTRWYFQGYATYTVVGMTSLERDRMFDELVRIIAFGREMPQTAEFRSIMEDNDLIAVSFDWDEIAQRGFAITNGTPWGTDRLIYEATVAMECFGEFISDGQTGTLVPLEGIRFFPYGPDEPDPSTIPGNPAAPPEGWH
jgi:hypothetical protein